MALRHSGLQYEVRAARPDPVVAKGLQRAAAAGPAVRRDAGGRVDPAGPRPGSGLCGTGRNGTNRNGTSGGISGAVRCETMPA